MGRPSLNFEQYADALFFVTKRGLSHARRFIIDSLGSCLPDDPIAVIEMANLCEVNAPWLLEQYLKLCERDEPLSNSEASRLSTLCVVAVSRIRETRSRHAGRTEGWLEGLKARSTNRPCCGRWGGGICSCKPPIGDPPPSAVQMIEEEEYLMKRTGGPRLGLVVNTLDFSE